MGKERTVPNRRAGLPSQTGSGKETPGRAPGRCRDGADVGAPGDSGVGQVARPLDLRSRRFSSVTTPDSNENFRESVFLSRPVDLRPTLENLARNTRLTYDDVVDHALVRYASSGAEALLAIEPQALGDLIAARKAEDWDKIGAIIDWLEAGLDSAEWR